MTLEMLSEIETIKDPMAKLIESIDGLETDGSTVSVVLESIKVCVNDLRAKEGKSPIEVFGEDAALMMPSEEGTETEVVACIIPPGEDNVIGTMAVNENNHQQFAIAPNGVLQKVVEILVKKS